ncbi:hypothetical protein UlMin_018931 [Ulmus minor]
MVGLAPEISQFDARQFDAKMTELLVTSGAEDFFTLYEEVFDSFDAMGLQENLLRGIYVYGFEKPSAIQQRGIVPFCQGLDVIQQAQSGTGKTATFCSCIVQLLDYSLVQCQALVQCLALIEKVMWALGDYLGVNIHACVGGTSVREDQRILQAGFMLLLELLGVSLTCYEGNHFILITLKCLCWMRLIKMLSRGFKDQVCSMSLLLIPLVGCRFTYLLQSGLHALFAFILS